MDSNPRAGVSKLVGQIQPNAGSYKKSFIGTEGCPFVSMVSMAALTRQLQGKVLSKETQLPRKSNLFTTKSFTKNPC